MLKICDELALYPLFCVFNTSLYPQQLTVILSSLDPYIDSDQRDKTEMVPANYETEANGDSWSTYQRGPSLVGSLRSSCRYYRFFCSALAALVSPVQNIIFLTAHFFTSLVPIVQQPRQAVVLGCLSLCL